MACAEGCTSIYLSPHLDDAALSCGGRIWQQVQDGQRVAAVTVFAAGPQPDARLSSYARELHARWGQSVETVEVRQEEDVRALSLLGAEPLHWPYPDCIYRRTPGGRYPYASEEALWGEIHGSEASMIGELAERMQALPLAADGALFVPLAVGRHVDHRIVRQAAEVCGRSISYYEDFPYAGDDGAVEAALADNDWEAELLPLSQEALRAKIAAIACYRSQIPTFWRAVADMAAAVRAFAETTGSGGAPAERCWRPTRP